MLAMEECRSSFLIRAATLHGHFALPCNPYFRTQTALTPSTLVRGRLPSLLLNCGTLYLNILFKSASSLSTFKTAFKTYLFRCHLLDDQRCLCSSIILIFVIVIGIIDIIYCKCIDIFNCALRTFLLLLLLLLLLLNKIHVPSTGLHWNASATFCIWSVTV